MTSPDHNAIESAHLALLDDEILLLEQLNATLAAERDAITKREIDALTTHGEAKLAAIGTLTALEERRKALGASRATPETAREQTRVDELKRLTRICSEMNGANEALLRAERRFVDSLLNLLRGGTARSSDVYGADAALSKPGLKRLPLASA
jgi:flagellar biosynthesis/type III secretory pathway chaperone